MDEPEKLRNHYGMIFTTFRKALVTGLALATSVIGVSDWAQAQNKQDFSHMAMGQGGTGLDMS